MNDVQTNQLGRAQKVNQFLQEKLAQLAATPDLNATLQPTLAAAITKANDSDNHAVQDDSGEAATKSEERTALEESSDHLSSGLVSYGDDTNDFVLMQMFDFPISTIEGFRDNRLLEYAKSVSEKVAVATIATALAASHNVSAADITAHNTNITNFETDIATPITRKAERTAWGKQVDRDITAVNDTLEKIRRKMRTYRKTNRLLFETFAATDTIDDFGHGGSGGTVSGTVNFSSTVLAANISYNGSAAVTLQNTGATPLNFQMYKSGAPIGTAITVAAANTAPSTMGKMAPDGDSIYVINNSTTSTGSYTITI